MAKGRLGVLSAIVGEFSRGLMPPPLQRPSPFLEFFFCRFSTSHLVASLVMLNVVMLYVFIYITTNPQNHSATRKRGQWRSCLWGRRQRSALGASLQSIIGSCQEARTPDVARRLSEFQRQGGAPAAFSFGVFATACCMLRNISRLLPTRLVARMVSVSVTDMGKPVLPKPPWESRRRRESCRFYCRCHRRPHPSEPSQPLVGCRPPPVAGRQLHEDCHCCHRNHRGLSPAAAGRWLLLLVQRPASATFSAAPSLRAAEGAACSTEAPWPTA